MIDEKKLDEMEDAEPSTFGNTIRIELIRLARLGLRSEKDSLRTVEQIAKERLGPAGWKMLEELKALRTECVRMAEALSALIREEPKDGESYACTWCDMGGSGYSSKGDGHHDDIKHECAVWRTEQALAACPLSTKLLEEKKMTNKQSWKEG